MINRRTFSGLSLVVVGTVICWEVLASPRELGTVEWERDFARAQLEARETGKPLFALFQEVPGCQTCVSFGDQVLSHPLLVEAIETEFVAAAVYNNRSGADRVVLERYGEPAWNNPIVRFLGGDGQDLVPRRSGVWQPDEIGQRMIAALEAAGAVAPAYLVSAVDELEPRATQQATFAMFCFWSGEACLGEVDGVMASRAGHLAGREVVELSFDPKQVSYETLVSAAMRRGCAEEVFAHGQQQFETARAVFGDAVRLADGYARDAKRSDQKHALRGTPYRKLTLTPRQAVRVNASVAARRSPAHLLSPRQRAAIGIDSSSAQESGP